MSKSSSTVTFFRLAREDRALHAFDLSSEDDAVLADARQGDLGGLLMAFAPKSLTAFRPRGVSWGTVETIPKSMPGTSGAVHASPSRR